MQVGFTSAGKFTSLDLHIYSNAGYGQDVSIAVSYHSNIITMTTSHTLQVLEKALTHTDNAYNIPNFRAVVKACRTNIAPNTAFRGAGGPQGMMIIEQVVCHVADKVGVAPETVRELNLYRDGDCTPWGQVQEVCPVRRCWERLQGVLQERTTAAEQFNK